MQEHQLSACLNDPGSCPSPGGQPLELSTHMKRLAVVQSNYIPWKGYFDLIASVDEFVFYDEVQYTKNDWRNRNRIKTPQGVQWLSIPVGISLRRKIRDVCIDDPGCGPSHWQRLGANYARARHFKPIADWLEPLFRGRPWINLAEVNHSLIAAVCRFLNIDTRLTHSTDYPSDGDRTQRLVGLCQKAGADVYVSGPSARSYLDEAAFASAGIEVEWFEYGPYPSYPQLWGEFVHEVSIVDLLFNCGDQAAQYMTHARR